MNNIQDTGEWCAIVSIHFEDTLDEKVRVDLPELGQDKRTTCSAFQVHDKQTT